MDEKTASTPPVAAATPASAPAAPEKPRRSKAELLDAIDSNARRLLGGRAATIEALTAELRVAT